MTVSQYPPPPFELQRGSDASDAHSANLNAVIKDHAKHPEKWEWLCRAADYAVAQGIKQLGIAAIVEDCRRFARDPRNADQREAEFKFSNTARAFYARALEDAGVAPVGFIKFKRQPSKGKPPAKPITPADVEPDPLRSDKRGAR